MLNYLKALRPTQWYKNSIVFLALIFSGNLFTPLLWQASIAFASFCTLASSVYLINDIVDRNKDRQHPEKKHRPIASGKVSVLEAGIMAVILFSIGLYLSFSLPTAFTYSALTYFFLSQLYTFWLKREAFLDILVIATNFVIRAIAGALAISVFVSPWLVLGVFFLAIYLVLGKRRSDILFLKHKASKTRETLALYTPELIAQFSTTATTCLVIVYTLYVFFGPHQALYLTLPPALYALFRYEALITTKTARHPELALLDIRMLISIALWLIIALLAIY